jgi:undecaprenyl-diphosphatase
VLLIPMCILNADLSLFYAFVCTIGSVSGAIFGYYLGKKGGRPILLRFASQQKIEKVEDLFNEHGALAVALAAFTPIPYKVFTISSGVLNYKIHLFVLASIVGRGGRFFIEAAIMMHFGERMLAFVSSYFEVATLLFGIGVLFIYIVYRLWR